MSRARPQDMLKSGSVSPRRLRRGLQVLRTGGVHELAQRTARAAYRHFDASTLEFPLLFEDIADSRQVNLASPGTPPPRSRRLNVGFVTVPPARGSGGHTTMFRMVSALESAGHRCVLLLYDRHKGNLADHTAVIRASWPQVRATVQDVRAGIRGLDACVATAWPTAHVLARNGTEPMRRFYFVQDFEPYFYPHGAEYSLAEDSYQFGFHCITIGDMLARMLREMTGMQADVVPFGCEEDVYSVTATGRRDGVVFYARPQAPRRGFMLGLAALTELSRRRPEIPIHLVGDPNVSPPFPAVVEGTLTPSQLAGLFNRCRAGVALSFTNMTLMAEELLACGTVPVINDLPFAAEEVRSRYVRWVDPTATSIVQALIEVFERPPDPHEVSATARRGGWAPAQDTFVRVIEREVYQDGR